MTLNFREIITLIRAFLTLVKVDPLLEKQSSPALHVEIRISISRASLLLFSFYKLTLYKVTFILGDFRYLLS